MTDEFQKILEIWIEKKFKSPLIEKIFNNRWQDPFHLYPSDYNPNNLSFIDTPTFEYYVIKPECLICTGKYEGNPMSCWNDPQCKFTFRPRNDGYPFFISGIIETTIDKQNPVTITLGRDLLVYNYVNRNYLKCVFRTSQFTGTHLHHINRKHIDDSLENHVVATTSPHRKMHTLSYPPFIDVKYVVCENSSEWFLLIQQFCRIIKERSNQ